LCEHGQKVGAIYFTDPMGFVPAQDQWDLTYAGVYRVSADRGAITLLANDFVFPNGLAFSPDESVLYIIDWQRGHIRAFDVAPHGTLAKQTDRIFADLRGPQPGAPDGMKVDRAGNVFCGGSGGIYMLDPKGKKLGRIVHGYPETSNIAFGGDDWKNLYSTTRNTLGSMYLKIAGLPVNWSNPSRRLPTSQSHSDMEAVSYSFFGSACPLRQPSHVMPPWPPSRPTWIPPRRPSVPRRLVASLRRPARMGSLDRGPIEEAPHLFGRQCHVMRHLRLRSARVIFTFTAGHRRIAHQLRGRHLVFRRGFLDRSGLYGTKPNGFCGHLVDVR
jgi:hypothetical protein